jgi:hypothetical protein
MARSTGQHVREHRVNDMAVPRDNATRLAGQGAWIWKKLLLQRRSSASVLDYHQMRFLNRCRRPAIVNSELSVAVLEPLLIPISNSGL